MHRSPIRRLTLVVGLALCLVATGCSNGDDNGDSHRTTTSSSSTPKSESTPSTGSSTSSSTPVTPTQTTPSKPTRYTTTARDAVNELKAAWLKHDRTRAAYIAPGKVIDSLWVHSPDNFEVYGCDNGEFETSSCNYRNRSTGIYITVTAQRYPQGWQIATVTIVQD